MVASNSKLIRIIGGGFSNKGAEAMLLVVVEAVRKCLPGVRILARLRKEDFETAKANGITLLETPPSRKLFRRIMAAIDPRKIRRKAGAVIDVGGYQFGDPWGLKFAHNELKMVKRWIRSGVPVFFMPQAWGPFSTVAITELVRDIINTATMSFARDKTSLRELRKIAGQDNPKVRFAHDIAWNFQGADLSVGRRLLTDVGVSKKDKMLTVCLTPNLQVYNRSSGRGPDNDYIRSLCDIIVHFCRAHNALVVLLEHQFSQRHPDEMNDRTLCKYVLSSLDRSLPVVHLDKTLSAAQIKSVIGNFDLLLSSRYHALIAALSQQIPAVAIRWSHKYDELMAEAGLGSNVISLTKTANEIIEQLDAMVERIPQAKVVLATKVPTMKQSGQKALDDVISSIRQRFQ
jgi:colanic acid/amylovoran biosynthesis protein